ncbi:MAG: VWA domain-containing protein [Oligoflexales bacterium]
MSLRNYLVMSLALCALKLSASPSFASDFDTNSIDYEPVEHRQQRWYKRPLVIAGAGLAALGVAGGAYGIYAATNDNSTETTNLPSSNTKSSLLAHEPDSYYDLDERSDYDSSYPTSSHLRTQSEGSKGSKSGKGGKGSKGSKSKGKGKGKGKGNIECSSKGKGGKSGKGGKGGKGSKGSKSSKSSSSSDSWTDCSGSASYSPSAMPTYIADSPSATPSDFTDIPSAKPIDSTQNPNPTPTKKPSKTTSENPSFQPTALTESPSPAPTKKDTNNPSAKPSYLTDRPSPAPTEKDTNNPSAKPSYLTDRPSPAPTEKKTDSPSNMPSYMTKSPSSAPTDCDTPMHPSPAPIELTDEPTLSPTELTDAPIPAPTNVPTEITDEPTPVPTPAPTNVPTEITDAPTPIPTEITGEPTSSPTDCDKTTEAPSDSPSFSQKPSSSPSESPSFTCGNRDIYILLDTSKTIGAEGWDILKGTATKIITDLYPDNPGIRFGIFRYNDEVDKIYTPLDEQDRATIYDVTDELSYLAGNTHTTDVIVAAIDTYDFINEVENQTNQAQIILLSDGRVAPNSQIPCPLTDMLEDRGIPVHIITHGEYDISEVECLTKYGNTTIFGWEDVLIDSYDLFGELCKN